MEVKLPYEPVRPSLVSRLVGWSVIISRRARSFIFHGPIGVLLYFGLANALCPDDISFVCSDKRLEDLPNQFAEIARKAREEEAAKYYEEYYYPEFEYDETDTVSSGLWADSEEPQSTVSREVEPEKSKFESSSPPSSPLIEKTGPSLTKGAFSKADAEKILKSSVDFLNFLSDSEDEVDLHIFICGAYIYY